MRLRFLQGPRRKLALLAMMAAIVVTSFVAFAPTAFAADFYVFTGNDSGGFIAYGEKLNACDMTKDGYRVLVYYWRADTNTTGVLIDANGAGSGSCTHRDLSIPEGESVGLKVCRQNGPSGPIFSCSAWKYGSA